jgi:CXXX repeat peptide maturase
VNLVLGKSRLPKNYDKAVNVITHSKIVPFELGSEYTEAIAVADINETEKVKGNFENLILKIRKEDIDKLPSWFKGSASNIKRLNIHISNIKDVNESDYALFDSSLKKTCDKAAVLYRNKNLIEINTLSDIFVLEKMNNCNAGLDHVTLAPNGKFYICPGFYYDKPDEPAGDLENGICVKNSQLLDLEHAPICSICSAYHCKRCVYLNKKLTMEINTPSRQQCVLSHIERENSRLLLEKCRDFPPFTDVKPMPKLDYYDPLDIITKKVEAVQEAAPDLTKMENQVINNPAINSNQTNFENDVKYLLSKIIDIQQAILNELRAKKGGANAGKRRKHKSRPGDAGRKG